MGLAAGTNVYAYGPNVWGWVDPLGLCKKGTQKSGEELYASIRNSTTDVANISTNYNLKPERLQGIKDYVFNNNKFNEPDVGTAESWIRLSQGKGTAHDMMLLKHETAEMFYNDWIPKNPEKYNAKYDPLDSHLLANEAGFNYEAGFKSRGPRNKDL